MSTATEQESTEQTAKQPTMRPAGTYAGDYREDSPPSGWVTLLRKHWKDAETVTLRARRGSRGEWEIVQQWFLTRPRAGIDLGPSECALDCWRAAWKHCEEEGGPFDYRLELHSDTSCTQELGKSTRGARLDVGGPSSIVAEESDLSSELGRWNEHAFRTLRQRDESATKLMQSCTAMLGQFATSLEKLTDLAAKLAMGGADLVRAQTERDAAAAEAERDGQAQDAEQRRADRRLEILNERIEQWAPQVGPAVGMWLGNQAEASARAAWASRSRVWSVAAEYSTDDPELHRILERMRVAQPHAEHATYVPSPTLPRAIYDAVTDYVEACKVS